MAEPNINIVTTSNVPSNTPTYTDRLRLHERHEEVRRRYQERKKK